MRWWDLLGPIPDILPPTISEPYKTFSSAFQPTKEEGKYPPFLVFCATFNISWVLGWEFEYVPYPLNSDILILVRRYKVKWWDGFNFYDKVSTTAVLQWLQSRNKALVPAMVGKAFLSERAMAVSKLAGATSEEDFYALMKKAVTDYEESQGLSHHSGNTNEDDCYGINLADDEEEEGSDHQ